MQQQAQDVQAEGDADLKLQQLHTAWAHRHTTAEELSSQDSELTVQADKAVIDAHKLTASPGLHNLSAHITQPLYHMLSAVSQTFALLFNAAEPAEQLSGRKPSQFGSWQATESAVSTLRAMLYKLFQSAPVSGPSASGGTEPDSHQSSMYDSMTNSLSSAFKHMNQNMLLPCLIAQLTASAEAAPLTKQNQAELPDDDQSLLEDLSHLELDSVSQQAPSLKASSDTAAPQQSISHQQPQTPELMPFSDFDMSLPGVDDSLEPLGEGNSQDQVLADATAPELVAFTDFDPSLAGMDELLELEAESSSTKASHNPTQLLESGIDAETHASSGDAAHEGSNKAASDATDTQHLSQAMLHFLQCAGAVSAAEQREQSMVAVEAELQRLMDTDQQKEVVCFEWLYEPALQEALQSQGGLGEPVVISPPVSMLQSCHHV